MISRIAFLVASGFLKSLMNSNGSLIVSQNPLQNFKTLYITGAVRLNDATNKPERVGGIDYVMKDGILYDAKKLAADVAAIVAASKKAPRATTAAPQ